MVFWCQFLDTHLTTYHLNIVFQIIVVFNLSRSTLQGTRLRKQTNEHQRRYNFYNVVLSAEQPLFIDFYSTIQMPFQQMPHAR